MALPAVDCLFPKVWQTISQNFRSYMKFLVEK
jgi:hypothetical protein